MSSLLQIHLLLLETRTGTNSARADIWVCTLVLLTFGLALNIKLVVIKGALALVRRFFMVDAFEICRYERYLSHEFSELLAMDLQTLGGDRQPGCFALFQEL